MKQFLVVIAAVFVFTGTAFARINPEGKVMLGANGDFGYTKSNPDSPDAKSDYHDTHGIGLKAGYGVFSNGIVYSGLE
jgi:hypothetical protein